MKPRNLISVFQGDAALEKSGLAVDKKYLSLKKHEIQNVQTFCDVMEMSGCEIKHFDGFYVGYTIAQIGKELDLLRFGQDFVLNIEIKGSLSEENKEQKILKQMRENYHYLRFLQLPIRIFTYVEGDGFYKYNQEVSALERVRAIDVAESLREQIVDYCKDPDREFVPSNYLISPFNSTDAFMSGEYFLTRAQQRIKEEIVKELKDVPFMFFCISANAGTGKTLLMYDIAKEQINYGKKVKIIHCGLLNDGQRRLQSEYGWEICSISDIPSNKDFIHFEGYDMIFVDESQRIRRNQLDAIIESAEINQVPVIFSYDIKQYLRSGESRNMTEYLERNYPHVNTSTKKLTNKIRTNKAMASFTTNLLNIGKSNDNLDYDCITIEYMEDMSKLKQYILFLEGMGWTPITFTTSQRTADPYDEIANVCNKNAHSVIGQEFSKVVLVMDQNFSYEDDGRLRVTASYYSARGMLYQIVTRVVDELKIVVLSNPPLFAKLLEIKAMGEK